MDRQLVNALCGPLNVQRHVLAGSQTLQLRPAAASSGTDDPDSDADAAYDVLSCSAWPLQPGDLVDSTGAGDAFIGGFLSAWVTGLGDDASCLTLATTVAAAKLRKKGAREGLPTAEEVNGRIHDLLRRATERDVT
jgi:sugar/nucleoside kinase (ribokinase family)